MCLPLAALVVLAAASVQAQPARPLYLDTAHTSTLEAGGEDRYALDLDAGTFVSGAVQQLSVDVVVTVTGPDGAEVGAFDEPARGPEPFQFEAGPAGRYTVAVEPFEDEAGTYTVALSRVEPVATTPAGRVDQTMARFEGDRPGAVVAVVEGGEVVFESAYGLASLTHGVPMTLGTRTNIGSTSKQFTAFALGLLEQRGRLDLDDDVREYVPELPDFGPAVTLRHLLTHTSGFRELYNTLAVAGRRISEGDYVDRAEVVGVVRRQPALQNDPGAAWAYNNTGYALAALVVERVTGRPFPEWMDENVFGPLGMTSTVVRADASTVVPGRAEGYTVGADGRWHEARDLGAAVGAGAVYTTVGDLVRWARNYQTAALGGADWVREMTTPAVLTDGDTTGYGLGLFVDEWRGQRRVHHGGADVAHRSMFALFPDLGAGVIVATNAPEDVGVLADSVALAFFGDRFDDPPETTGAPAAAPGAVAFDDALFDDYTGRYALDAAPDVVLTFRRSGDGGYLAQAVGQPELEIVPTSDSTFALTAVEAGVTFHRDPDGVVRSATLHQNGDHRATRLDAVSPPEPPDSRQFVGRYASEELGVSYTVALEDGTLSVRLPRYPEPFPLDVAGEDTFTFSVWGGALTAAFERDADGTVTGFALDAGGRARGIRFKRAE